jgi:hypothetical protein
MYLGVVCLGLLAIDLGDGVCINGPNACTIFLGLIGEGTDGMMLLRNIWLPGPDIWI